MIVKQIVFFGQPAILACDGNCRKAWGINRRKKHQLSDNEDDYEWLADDELGRAPTDPGSYEGGHAKPTDYEDADRQNKWCARECERSELLKPGEPIVLDDFTKRIPNIKAKATTPGDPRP